MDARFNIVRGELLQESMDEAGDMMQQNLAVNTSVNQDGFQRQRRTFAGSFKRNRATTLYGAAYDETQ